MIDLPAVHVDSTACAAVSDVVGEKTDEAQFWAEVDDSYFDVHVCRTGSDVTLQCSHPAELTLPRTLNLGDITIDLGTSYFKLPPKSISISTGDIHNGQALLGDTNGGLCLYTAAGVVQTQFEGHSVYTSVARFFPSGQVVLSAGMDYAVKIWDCGTGDLAQTLQYQRGLVEEVGLIGRGRNIVTLCPNDDLHTAVLWDVGSAKVVHEAGVPTATSMGLSGGSRKNVDGPGEYGVSEHTAFIGTENGLLMWDLRAAHPTTFAQAKVSHVASEGLLVAAAVNDIVAVMDVRKPGQHLQELNISGARLSMGKNTLVVTRDGTWAVPLNSQSRTRVLAADPSTVSVTIDDKIWSIGRSISSFDVPSN